MSKEKNNSNGLDNLDNYFMSITYMLKFLTYINQPSGKEIEEIFNDILLKIEDIKIEDIKKEPFKYKDQRLKPKIERIINFITFNKTLLESKAWIPNTWDWKRNWSADKMRELFIWEVKEGDNSFYNKLEIKDDDPLIEALSHVVDLLSRHASIIVLNKRIISSGYDTTLPINSDFKKLINLESEITEEKKTYEKKYTIINSVVSAINNSANVQASTKGATIYTTSLLTPKDVYFAIQAEIKEIIYLEIDYNETTSEDFSYDKESKEVIGMLLESGINYKKILINNKTNKNNFLKSIIDFGYYYKSEEKSQKIQRNELLSFTGFLSKVQFGVKKDIKGKVLINSETWVNTIFMAISYIVSFRSFDDGSKVGCSFVKEVEFGGFKQYILYSTGYNGFPNTLSRFHDKLKKDEYMVHAETNAILSIIKNNAKIHKHTIVYSNLYSCDECLKSLFNVGVKKIIYFEDRYKVRSNIKDVKNSFLSNEEYFENISLFDENIRIQKTLNCEKCEDLKDKCEKCIIKPFINSFISLCKFNYFFNKNTDDLKQAKDYIVEYYSNYNLLNFLKINKDEQHQTIFNGDLRLDDIEEIFKNIVKLINDYIKKSNKVENKNYEENYDEVFYKNYIKNCNKVANKNCEEKYLANYDEVFYKDCQNIIDIYSKKEEKKE